MRTPLVIMSIFFTISFFDGMFMWGLGDGFYSLAGLAMIGSIIWMWFVEINHGKKLLNDE